MKKVFQVCCLLILALFVYAGFVFIASRVARNSGIDVSEEVPPASVKRSASPSVEKTMPDETDTSAEESDFFKEFAEEKKRLQAEWDLPENANLKQLLKTVPVSETFEYITESCKGYPSSDTVKYARKTLEIRQMPSMIRILVEDMLRAEHEMGPNAYVRAYDSMVVEVQGRFYRATLDGDIEFEVWDKNRVFVVGTLQCIFPESQYNMRTHILCRGRMKIMFSYREVSLLLPHRL